MLITVHSCLERAVPVQRGQQTGGTQGRTTRLIGLCRLAAPSPAMVRATRIKLRGGRTQQTGPTTGQCRGLFLALGGGGRARGRRRAGVGAV